MSAPLCTVCLDTGSKSQFSGGELDCVSCGVATERAAMNRAIEQRKNELTGEYRLSTFSAEWFAYQLGKAAATTMVPIAKQKGAPLGWHQLYFKYAGNGWVQCGSLANGARKFYCAPLANISTAAPVTCPDPDACNRSGCCNPGGRCEEAAPVVPVAAQPVVQQEPVAYLRFWAAMSHGGSQNNDIDYGEGLEVCQQGEIGDDKLPAFPVYAAPQPAASVTDVAKDADSEDQLRGEGWLKAMEQVSALLPGPYYMDPPDGGSVTVLEQLQRMATDAERYRFIKENIQDGHDLPNGFHLSAIYKDSWDATIDAAIAAQQGEKTK